MKAKVTSFIFLFIACVLYNKAQGQINIPATGRNTMACNGTLLDPGGSGNYTSDCDGYTVIAGKPGATITISGTYALEAGCSCDYVRIYTGVGTATQVASYTNGSGTITSYTGAAGQTLTVRFISDGGVVAGGINFTVTYSSSGACPSTVLVSGAGTNSVTCGTNALLVDHAGENTNYSNNRDDYTVLNNVSGSTAVINLNGAYALESGCNCDYIRIYAGSGTGGALLATYTNSAAGTISYTGAAGQTLTVRFTSDGASTSGGFSIIATYSGSCTLPACSGTPTAGTTSISSASGASGVSFTLSNSGATSGQSGITYQWQSSPDNSTWTNIAGATSTSYVASSNIEIQYYRMVTTCSNGGATATSNVVSYTVTSWLQPSSGTTSYTTCSGTFYDPGGSGSNYSDNQSSVVTFYPATTGTVLSFNFTSFTTENASCATDYDWLKIYNGNSTAATLINCYSTGGTTPGTIISSAADGSLTFSFKSDGGTNAAGWAATISCLTPTAPNCATYTSPADGADFCTSPTTLTWTAPTSGFAPTGYKLYYGTNNPPTNIVNGTNLGNVLSYTTGALTSGTTYYWKIVPTNSAGDATSCALQSFTRGICYNMSNGSATTCSGTFYDQGGISGSASDNSNLVFTFCPSVAGQCSGINFHHFGLENGYDYLYVYDGNSTAAPQISGSPFTGSRSAFNLMGTATNATGCLTYRYVSDSNYGSTGWDASIICGQCGAGYTWTAQDCFGGITVCNDQAFSGNSLGEGEIDDLSSSNRGCLSTEHQSSWYLFSPATSGGIQLAITPANGIDDYDFAIWGPLASIACPPAASPFRCSYSQFGGNTGLNGTAGDASEGVGGDKWVSQMNVTAGQKFIMLIDNYSASSQPYTLDWTLTGGATLSCTLLSVDLLSFKAVNRYNYNYLTWTTQSEINNEWFEIESSIDGKKFKSIGKIKGAGYSNSKRDYEFKDFNYSKTNYYRIKQIDMDGKSMYSDIIVVNSGDYLVSVDLVPNPATDIVNVHLGIPNEGVLKIEITDLYGRILSAESFEEKTGETSKEFSVKDFNTGIYLVRVVFNDRLIQTKKLVKQ